MCFHFVLQKYLSKHKFMHSWCSNCIGINTVITCRNSFMNYWNCDILLYRNELIDVWNMILPLTTFWLKFKKLRKCHVPTMIIELKVISYTWFCSVFIPLREPSVNVGQFTECVSICVRYCYERDVQKCTGLLQYTFLFWFSSLV